MGEAVLRGGWGGWGNWLRIDREVWMIGWEALGMHSGWRSWVGTAGVMVMWDRYWGHEEL